MVKITFFLSIALLLSILTNSVCAQTETNKVPSKPVSETKPTPTQTIISKPTDKLPEDSLAARPIPGPLLYGAGLLQFGYDNTVIFNRRTEKLPQGWLDGYLLEICGAIYSRTYTSAYDTNLNLAIGLFLPVVETLWVNDALMPDRIQTLIVKRLKTLVPDSTKEWSRELERVGSYEYNRNSSAPYLEAVGYLIQIDRIYTKDELNKNEANILFARLKALSKENVVTVTKALSGQRNRSLREQQAAILLVQEDSLFAGDNLNPVAFEKAVKDLESKITKK